MKPHQVDCMENMISHHLGHDMSVGLDGAYALDQKSRLGGVDFEAKHDIPSPWTWNECWH